MTESVTDVTPETAELGDAADDAVGFVGVPVTHGLGVVAVFRGLGVPVAKSDPLLLLSEQRLLRIAAVMLVRVGPTLPS